MQTNKQTNKKQKADQIFLHTTMHSPTVHKIRSPSYFHQRQLFELDEIVRGLIDENWVLDRTV